ncbi:hypothetical protein FLONG3_578 [Fusarium longipes]|uniref:Heterokaryon incompatibility domain-containing protein n=1 Tax=Fusarium longipes TaxID=694270 RepID=A0A395T9S5_9HYPO|nr:hypothetical protein FLONG3_578 [Fusarium longipes]
MQACSHITEFIINHNEINRLYVHERGDALGSAAHLDRCVIPALMSRDFDNLRSLSLAWGSGSMDESTKPHQVNIPHTALEAIGRLVSLEQLSLRAGSSLGWRHQWLVNHDELRRQFDQLKQLKMLALVRDTYPIPLPGVDVERYYKLQFIGKQETIDAEARPELDLNENDPFGALRLILNGSNGIGTVRKTERLSELPSWAPDFTRAPGNPCDRFDPWQTPIDCKPEVQFCERGILSAKGLIIDHVSGYELEEAEDFDRRKWWKLACLQGQDVPYPTGIPRIQAYFRTLIFASPNAGHKDDQEFFELAVGFMLSMMQKREDDPRASSKSAEFCRMVKQEFGASDKQLFEALTQYGWHVFLFIQMTGALDHLTEACIEAGGLQGITDMSEQAILEGFCGPESDPSHLEWVRKFGVPEDGMVLHKKFGTHINLRLRHDAFFITSSGYMGLGPKGVQEGDVICVLFGCSQVLMLRPVDDYYLVVGSCFIDGISGKSQFSLLNSEAFQIEKLKIR